MPQAYKKDFLHFLWKHQKFLQTNLKTTQGVDLQFVSQGIHNKHAGPDFSNARLKIDSLDWVGHVEIYLNYPIGLPTNIKPTQITMRLFSM